MIKATVFVSLWEDRDSQKSDLVQKDNGNRQTSCAKHRGHSKTAEGIGTDTTQ